MSEIQVNQQVFKAFQQATKNGKIDKGELESIKQAIMADGDVDLSEENLIRSLKNGDKDTLVSGGEKLDFDASKLRNKELSRTIGSWNQATDGFLKAFEGKMADGGFSPDDLASLRKAVKTPADLELLGQLGSTTDGSRAEVRIQDATFRFDRKAGNWQIDKEYLEMDLYQQAESALKAKPGSPERKQLLRLLEHPAPAVREAALKVLSDRIGQRWDLIQDLKAGKLKQTQPAAYEQLLKSRTDSINESYSAWQKDLPGRLAALPGKNGEDAALDAYLLANDLKFYGEVTRTPLDPALAKQHKQTILSLAKEALAKPDLPPESRLYWLHASFVLDPKATAPALEKFLLSAPQATRPEMENALQSALGALLEQSPRASEIAMKVIETSGKSSRWVKESAVRFLQREEQKLKPEQLKELLHSDRVTARLAALDKLVKLDSPAAVDMALNHYRRHGNSLDDGWRAESVLKRLSESKNKDTAAAAKEALASISGMQALDTSQDDAASPNARLDGLLDAMEQPGLRADSVERLIQLLEDSSSSERQTLLDQLGGRMGKLGPDAARLAEQVHQTYSQAGQEIGADLRRLGWLKRPADQLRQLEAMIKAHPGHEAEIAAALKEAQAKHRAQPLDLDQKADFGRLRYLVEPSSLPELKAQLGEAGNVPEGKYPLADEARHRALKTVFEHADLNPETKAWGHEIIAGKDKTAAGIAAGAFKAQAWRDQDDRDALLRSPHWEARKLGLDQIRDEILADPKSGFLFQVLESHHRKTADSAGRRYIEDLMDQVAKANLPISTDAKNYVSHLAAERHDPLVYVSGPEKVDAENGKERVHKALRALIENEDFDKFARAVGIEPEYMERLSFSPGTNPALYDADFKRAMLIKYVLAKKPGLADDFAKYATPHQKGLMVRWYSKLDNSDSRALATKLLMSIDNLKDHDTMLRTLRHTSTEPPDFAEIMGSKAAGEFLAKVEGLRRFDKNLVTTNRFTMSEDPIEKGEMMGKALADLRDKKLTQPEAAEVLGRLIRSFATRDEYDQALGEMLSKQGFSEDDLAKAVGDKAYGELSAGVGVRKAETSYSSEEELVMELQDFFDLVARHSGQDGDLVADWLEKKVPEVREHAIFRRYFRDPELEDRLMISKLIADGKVKVDHVGSAFVDRKLFGRHDPGIFELHGRQKVTNQLHHSVMHKAQQFIAVDKAAKKIHDKTFEMLHGKAEELRQLAGDEAYLQTVLDGMKDFTAPYREQIDLLKNPQLAGWAKQDLMAKIKANKPELKTDADRKAFYEQLMQVEKTRAHYGSAAAGAAKKMKSEANALDEMAGRLGVTGNYEDHRSEFLRYGAFQLYHSDMDVLRGEIETIFKEMGGEGAQAKAVFDKAEDLEDEIDTVKGAAVWVAEQLPGIKHAVWAMKVVVKGMDYHFRAKELNELGLMSDGALQAKKTAIALDIVSKGISVGTDQIGKAIKGSMQKELGAQLEATLAKEAAEKKLDAEGQRLLREALEKEIESEIKRQVAFYTGVISASIAIPRALNEGKPGKALAELLKIGIKTQIRDVKPEKMYEKALEVASTLGSTAGGYADGKIASLRSFGNNAKKPLTNETRQQMETVMAEAKRQYPQADFPKELHNEGDLARMLVALANIPGE